MSVKSKSLVSLGMMFLIAHALDAQAAPTRRVTVSKEEIVMTPRQPITTDTLTMPQQPGIICTMEARPAVQVSVADENGAMLPAGTSVRVIARDGSYADSTTVITDSNPRSFGLAYERPGTYQIELSASGFAPAAISDITVPRTPDGCHVSTRQLTALVHR